MSDELTFLTYTVLLTALLWVPYILNQISVQGLVNAVGYQDNPAPLASWAQRLKAAHYNGVENLAVFAPLVIIVEILQISSSATVVSCMVYFYARLVHALSYTFAIPWVRTISFAISFFATIGIAYQILTAF